MFRRLACLTLLGLMPSLAAAETAWVSDQFEVLLRTGPSTANAIEAMLRSGTPVEILEWEEGAEYARVRTRGGSEGWVLTRYLMDEPSAREQLERLTEQLSSATTRGSSLDSQLDAVRGEYESAQNRIRQLENEKSTLEAELAEIRRTAANVLSINEQNKELREQLVDTEVRVDALEEENRGLSRQTNRYWFMSGALVLVVGVVMGLWLPRIRWQRRSRYDRF